MTTITRCPFCGAELANLIYGGLMCCTDSCAVRHMILTEFDIPRLTASLAAARAAGFAEAVEAAAQYAVSQGKTHFAAEIRELYPSNTTKETRADFIDRANADKPYKCRH